MKPNWIIAKKQSNIILDQLLLNRGIDLREKTKFLNPDFSRDLLDPMDLHDMKKACKMIKEAIDTGEKMGIFSDYDADGVPGAAILAKTIEILGGKYSVYIPSRAEGYGLNKKGIQELYDDGCKLLITIDLGITSNDEVKFAQKIGMKVIITDHHQIQKEKYTVTADAVVHALISKKYANKNLCGAGVAYKIAQAMGILYGRPNESQFKWMSDLVSISTICDIVPLEGENRVLAKYGMIALRKTHNLGLKYLMEYAKIDEEKINTYTVGFQIGPRINAPGRMEHAQLSYWLLTTSDEDKAKELAKKLDETNIKRQENLSKAVDKSIDIIKKDNLDKEHIIIVTGKNWSGGIVGLVASKITEKYNRPSIVFSEEDGILRGSGRSIDEFDLVKHLARVEKYLTSFGGHKKAAGVSVAKENFEKFYKAITELAKKEIDEKDLVKKIKIDMEITGKDINFTSFDDIKKMEPFGYGNPKPVFVAKNLRIASCRWVGKEEKHLQLQLRSEKSEKLFKSILFNPDKKLCTLKNDSIVDVVFNLEENIWNGKRYLDLKIIDYDKVGLI